VNAANADHWHLRLFRRSVLKRAKLREIQRMLGPTQGLRCLDLGSDNGVVSWHLRKGGGRWASADLAEEAVGSIRSLVGEEVYRVDGKTLPFPDREFDAVVVVDMLEHVEDDRGLLREIGRVLRPGGTAIFNVPHAKRGALLRPVRHALGLTDDWHGHLRPGYTAASLAVLLSGTGLSLVLSRTYSRFFTELLDTALNVAYTKGGKSSSTTKGTIVTQDDMARHRRAFRLYSAVWPAMWAVSNVDRLIGFTRGYMLIARARKHL
jgi:SAM-dependent methyltransferase